MRTWLAVGVVLFGIVVLGAGAVAMYNHAVIADETGISGWNPALWLLLLSGVAIVLIGTLQAGLAVGAASSGDSPSR